MKCLRKYNWLKLYRAHMPSGKGIMGYWAKLASRAAFRKGVGIYCGYKNAVTPGMWSGGIVGLKSILGVKRREQALGIIHELEELGYLNFSLDEKTKKVSYQINDWVLNCAGGEGDDGTVYASDGFGFVCMPRTITERLVQYKRIFDEADAWLDLWCHTVYRDYGNAFSFLGHTVQYGKYSSVVTLEGLGKRWNWEKTKVWRFFQKNSDSFALYRLPSSYGCIIYNAQYCQLTPVQLPEKEDVLLLLTEIRDASRKGIIARSETDRVNMMIAWNSRKVVKTREVDAEKQSEKSCVAPVKMYTRAYFSNHRNYMCCRKCIYDCRNIILGVGFLASFISIERVCPSHVIVFSNDTS